MNNNELDKNSEVQPQLRMITIKELSEELTISEATIYNWRKSRLTKNLIAPFVTKIGKVNYYDVEAILMAIQENLSFFGGGNHYDYKSLTPAAIKNKTDLKFWLLKRKILKDRSDNISETDAAFYRSECEIRGEKSLLDIKLRGI